MMQKKMLLICCAIALAVAVGCKKESNRRRGGSGGGSLLDQYDDAMKETDPTIRAERLVSVAKKQIQAQMASAALTTLRSAEEAADDISIETDAQLRADVHINLAYAYHKAGERSEFKDAYKEAEEATAKVDGAALHADLLIKLATLDGVADKKDKAAGNLKIAEKRVEELENITERVEFLGRIARRYWVLKDDAERDRVLAKMVEIAEAVEKPGDRSRALTAVAKAQVKMKQKDAALETLNKALEVARSIEENKLREAWMLSYVAEGFGNAGRKKKAKDILVEADDLVRGNRDAEALRDRIQNLLGKVER